MKIVNFIMVVFLFFTSVAFSQEQLPVQPPPPLEWVRIITPWDNSEVIGKKPEIKVEFVGQSVRNNLLVTLDGTDITQILILSDKGFEYKPVMPMSAGLHTLSLTALDANGAQMQKSFTFKLKHSEIFEEASSSNEASVIYSQAISNPTSTPPASGTPPQNQTPQPTTTVAGFDSKIEGNLKSDNKIRNGNWEVTLNGNIRYFDQNTPASSPVNKGMDVANWLMTGTYKKDSFRMQASVGDVQVNETSNTINMSSKGGILEFDYDIYQFRAFSLQSQQTFGISGGLGIGGAGDNIFGASADVKLFERKAEFKTIYLTGQGDDNNTTTSTANPVPGSVTSPFGASNQPGHKKGDVLGFLLTSDFFQNKIKTEFEADFSKYDPDTSDEFGSQSDSAYLARAYGVLGIYNYDAKYEYFGRDYATVGNPGALKDRQAITLSQGLNIDKHTFLFVLSGSNDNVANDPQIARTYQYAGNINYTYNGIQNLPIGVGYQASLQESQKEPVGAPSVNTLVNTFSANASYTTGKLTLALTALFSILDDRTSSNADTTTATITLSPSYNQPNFTATPMFSFNSSTNEKTDVRTNSYTGGLNLLSKLYGEILTFDMGGTYTMVKADDSSVSTQQINVTANLSYHLKAEYVKYINPVFTLKNTYIKTMDDVNPSANSDNYALFLVVTGNMPFIF